MGVHVILPCVALQNFLFLDKIFTLLNLSVLGNSNQASIGLAIDRIHLSIFTGFMFCFLLQFDLVELRHLNFLSSFLRLIVYYLSSSSESLCIIVKHLEFFLPYALSRELLLSPPPQKPLLSTRVGTLF